MPKMTIKISPSGEIQVEFGHQGNQCNFDPKVAKVERYLKDLGGDLKVQPIVDRSLLAQRQELRLKED